MNLSLRGAERRGNHIHFYPHLLICILILAFLLPAFNFYLSLHEFRILLFIAALTVNGNLNLIFLHSLSFPFFRH
jgi:hypothetical protein